MESVFTNREENMGMLENLKIIDGEQFQLKTLIKRN